MAFFLIKTIKGVSTMNFMTSEIFECPQDFWFDETAVKFMIRATSILPRKEGDDYEEERTERTDI